MLTMTAIVLLLTLASLAGLSPRGNAVHGQVMYHLLIIAPDEFLDELEPLRRFKDASARPTILVSLDQVDQQFPGVDLPEKVKRCIDHNVQYHGVKHVLLVGDIDKFPARYRWWGLVRYIDGEFAYDQRGWAVSDLYYADLYKHGTRTFDDWDANKNGLYGEIQFDEPLNCNEATYGCTINQDSIDFLPDVSVGRMPASTADEVVTYVGKVIAYELKTLPSDSWFRRVALYSGDEVGNPAIKDKIGGFFPGGSTGFQLIKRYHGTSPGTKQDVINDLNNGVGFVNYLGHGSVDGWKPGALGGTLDFDSSDLKAVSNADKLPVVFAGACDTGLFAGLVPGDPYVDEGANEHCGMANGEDALVIDDYPDDDPPYPLLPRPAPVQDDSGDGAITCPLPGDVCPDPRCDCTDCEFDPPCFAEYLVFGHAPGDPPSANGAIAYLGERSGGREWAQDLDEYFFKAYTDGEVVLGDMWRQMIEAYYDHHNLAQSHAWLVDSSGWNTGHEFDEPQKLILFGDPSLVVGGAFADARSGFVWDSNGAPWFAYRRYRVAGHGIAVPSGQKLTAFQGTSVMFEDGSKITAWGTEPDQGLILNATAGMPVHFLSLSPDPQSEHVVHGMKVTGQVRVRNGGQVKLH
jgi:hypothetical protein